MGNFTVPVYAPKVTLFYIIVSLGHFQFEVLRMSNHTACHFAEKTRFFRSKLSQTADGQGKNRAFCRFQKQNALEYAGFGEEGRV